MVRRIARRRTDAPRVVMLVDNAVRRDSRVQKEAASMAAAGWDVVVLGVTPRATFERFTVGGARVLLLPVTRTPRSSELRSLQWRRPLAYRSPEAAQARDRTLAARSADLWLRRITGAPEQGATTPLRSTGLVGARAALRARSAWSRLRAGQTTRAEELRRTRSGRVDAAALALHRRLGGPGAWRRLDPFLWDLELTFGPVIDRLRPTLIHANDFRMLGVGGRATLRARHAGRPTALVWDAHEFLPGMTTWSTDPWWKVAQVAHEREYAPLADAVVTVSDELAGLLQEEHGLSERPRVVLNCPSAADATTASGGPSVREACGLGPSDPLMVYSGGAAEQRGLHTMVAALPLLPEVSCAFVVPSTTSDYLQQVLAQAEELGVRDRVHPLPFVRHDQVVGYLASADVGVIPILHRPNHEIALITKFFEYSHARLPIVVSDVRTMAATVTETGQGEVFRAEDPEDLARCVRAVLADPQRYRDRYDGLLDAWTWEEQARVLASAYEHARTRAQS